MTVSVQTPFISAVAAGSATFLYSFRTLSATYLVVTVDGVTKTLTTDYSVTGVNDQGGGTVVFGVAPTVGAVVTIRRNTPFQRATDYQNNGDLLAGTVNPDFDALWMAMQDSGYLVSLAVALPHGDTAAPMTLPDVATRASKFMAFDALGNPLAAAGAASQFPVSAYMGTLLDDADAAAARTTLGAAAVSDLQAIQDMINGSGMQDYKASVRAATTANITLAGSAPSTLYGVTLVVNDRILVKDQTTGSQNGIYYVSTLGTGANGTWTRSTDADANSEVTSGLTVMVEEGTTNADSIWMLTTDGTIVVGTTTLTFARKDGSGAGACIGAFRNLKASATGTNATVSITYDELVLEDASNAYVTARAGSLSINTAAAAANGLDTGTLAANTWYYTWVIRKADGTTAGLISLSSTAPTLPSGYTFKVLIGVIRTDGTVNKYPLIYRQIGNDWYYGVAAASNATVQQVLASGAQGTWGSAWATVSVSSFVPPNAMTIKMSIGATTTSNVQCAVAPNSAYVPDPANAARPPLINGSAANFLFGEIVLESTNVYLSSQLSTVFHCLGFRLF